jgi:hypothetical protein
MRVLTMTFVLLTGLASAASADTPSAHGQPQGASQRCDGPAPTEWIEHGVDPQSRACPLDPDSKVAWDRIAPFKEHARRERSGRQG